MIEEEPCREDREALFHDYTVFLVLYEEERKFDDLVTERLDEMESAIEAGDHARKEKLWAEVQGYLAVLDGIRPKMEAAQEDMYEQWHTYLDCVHEAQTDHPRGEAP